MTLILAIGSWAIWIPGFLGGDGISFSFFLTCVFINVEDFALADEFCRAIYLMLGIHL